MGVLPRALPAALLAALVLLPAAGELRAADVYGKPLRGLTAVSVREAVSDPDRFAGRDVRVAGPNAGPDGKPALKEGGALLPVVPDGSFELPARLGTARLTAEGRVTKGPGGVVFVASGVEVRR
jgi:hypothetical protein